MYISNSADETRQIAAEITKKLKSGSVICMYGDLGAGKTAFVQGMALALGINEPVTSPTFTIVNEYYGTLPLYHFDVYRIGSSEEMYEIGFDEYINGNGICVIEWAELIEDILPEDSIRITIRKNIEKGEDYREIIVKGCKELENSCN